MEQSDKQRREVLSGIGRFQMSFLIRLISTANVVSLLIEILAPEYGLSRLLHLQRQIANWYVVTSVTLPLYVAFEGVWMHQKKLELRPVLIDALFAAAWFCLWWMALIGTIHKTGFPWL